MTTANEIVAKAMSAHRAGQLDVAIELYQRVQALAPNEPRVLINYAVALRASGSVDAAIEKLRHAIEINPSIADAHYNLGNAYREVQKNAEAAVSYQAAVDLKDDYIQAYTNQALAYRDLKQFDDAAGAVGRGLAAAPDNVDLLINLGLVLFDQHKYREATEVLKRALKLAPDNSVAHHSIATAYFKCNQLDLAIDAGRQAIALKPDFVEARATLGQCMASVGDLDDALAMFDQAIALDGENLNAHLGKARTLLLMGRLADGFEEYEWRWRRPEHAKRSLSYPEWDGSPITGKSILLYSEQGSGDAIQAVRYAALIANLGGKPIIECSPELAELMTTADGISGVVMADDKSAVYDFHAPMMSLPRLFRTDKATIPDAVPYLHYPKRSQEEYRIPTKRPALRVGIVWAGNPIHVNDAERSVSLTQLAPLLSIPGIDLFSLQVGKNAEDLKRQGFSPLVTDLTVHIENFADTAGLISQLDLVVSVDTSVAHLTGALGKPVWVLIPYAPDWRWGLSHTTTPWYPTMKLYRQVTPGDWQPPIDAIVRDLKAKAEHSS